MLLGYETKGNRTSFEYRKEIIDALPLWSIWSKHWLSGTQHADILGDRQPWEGDRLLPLPRQGSQAAVHSFQVHSSCTDGLAYQARCVLSESTLQFLLLNN